MDNAIWIFLIVLGLYLSFRWYTFREVRNQLSELQSEVRRLRELLSDVPSAVDESKRQVTQMQSSLHGVRRKLGFDDDWAENTHLEEQIGMLQAELEARKKRQAA